MSLARRVPALATFLVAGLALAGCSEDRAAAVDLGLQVISRVDAEPAGEHCAAGGHAVRSGADADRDGTLDDAEISAVEYVCHAPAETLLLRQDAEPAGPNCDVAGSAIRAGLDADGDGILADAEVLEVRYACGVPPEPPAPTVTRTVAEPAGEACPAGGSRVEAGPDLDGDGTLAETEVRSGGVVCAAGAVRSRTAKAYLSECGGRGSIVEIGVDADVDGALDDGEVTSSVRVCDESTALAYPVSTAEQVERLKDVRRIRGSLVIQGAAVESMFLWFDVVDGDIVVTENPGLKSLSLFVGLLGGGIRVSENPVLERAGIGHTSLYAAELGKLQIPGSVVIENNPKLQSALVSGHLGHVGGSLLLRNNPELYLGWAFEHLRFVGGTLELSGTTRVWGLDFPELGWVIGDVIIRGNAGLEETGGSFSHLAVRHVGGRLVFRDNPKLLRGPLTNLETVGGIELGDNPQLFLSLPKITAVHGDVVVQGDSRLPNLGTWDAPFRVITGSLVVMDNPRVVSVSYPMLVDIGGDLRLERNAELRGVGFAELGVAGDVRIVDNPRLEAIGPGEWTLVGFASLHSADSLTISGNPLLARLAMPELARVFSWLRIEDNPLLPACEAEALVAQLAFLPGSVRLGGNDDAATCP